MSADGSGWPWRFRQKASFVFGERDGRLTIGHYAALSNRIVPITECPVHSDRANRVAFALYDHLARSRIPSAGADLRGVVRHLLVRTSLDDRDAVAMLVVTRNERTLRAPIRKFLDGAERPTGFYLNIHNRPGPYMVGPETIRLGGHSHVRETVAGIPFLVAPTAFFQTNVAAAATLVDLVLSHASGPPSLRIVDLYAGSGLFSLPLAARGHEVTAVEDNPHAVADGERNARRNHLSGKVRFIRAAVEEALPRLVNQSYDAAVLDPPRAGCPPPVVRGVFNQMKPPTVAYVSCNPQALAAELPAIINSGYAAARVQPVDMFPHTTHIETVVTLTRR
jgi:23S rRNA (uracil-5-)-methyltransferase RumA